jgi:RNA polymerase primary sigma factor
MEAFRVTNKITNRQSPAFKRYLIEISKIKRFETPDHEARCAAKASLGDESAIKELIERNLRFVISVAKQYETSTILLEDLVNEGNIGLIRAVEKYNSNTGFKFISYAVFWIRKCIHEFLTNTGRIIRLPANRVLDISKFKAKQCELEQQKGDDVDDAEVMEALANSMTESELNDLATVLSMDVDSLDKTVSPEESSCMYEIIADNNIKGSDYLTYNSDIKIEVGILLKALKERDRNIMIMLYGLDGSTPMSLKEVGDKIGLTREMIRQIREKSLKTLKTIYTS